MSFSRIQYSKIAKEEGHSDEFIKETLEYAEHLEAKNLPVIFSTLHLSMLIGIEFHVMNNIIKNRCTFYKSYEIKKRKGGTRQISSPHRTLKIIQQWINKNILQCIPIDEQAYGFCPKKSIVDNAKKHLNHDYILNIDLLKFFDTITEERVYGIFKSLGYHSNLAVDLAKLCTSYLNEDYINSFDEIVRDKFKKIINKAVLPQGAPTSPTLSNIIARRLDKRLFGYAKNNNLQYSRYADDITFSGNGEKSIKISVISKIIQEENFEINKSKIRFFGKSSNKHIVTGLIVSEQVKIPNSFKNEIKRHLYFCLKFGVENHLKYLEEKTGSRKGYFKEWIRGKICFINMVEPEEGKKLFEKYNSINWVLG